MSGKKITKTTRRKTTGKAATKKKVHWFVRYHATSWIFVILVTVCALVAVLRLPEDRDSEKMSGPVETRDRRGDHRWVVPRKETFPTKELRQEIPSDSDVQVYEEEDNSLETRVKEVDLAIIQTLAGKGYDPSVLVHGSVDIRTWHGREYHFQRLDFVRSRDAHGFVEGLKKNLALLVEGASLTEDEGGTRVSVKVFGVPTHLITLRSGSSFTEETGLVPAGTARLVIVVDDLGRSVRAGKRLARLSFPVTFSVMPRERRSSELAALAGNAHKELILHLPMQPVSYPETNPGEGALFVDMTPEEIRKTVQDDLARVPGARGANNHMGSLFTQTPAGMKVVMDLFKERSLFFLDSMTTSKSCVRRVMAAEDMPYLRRNIFLDNVRDEKAILFQLRKAESLARKHGYAIAIGHPYPETLNVLEAWQRARSSTVAAVRLQDLF